jgi:hypothetical protein
MAQPAARRPAGKARVMITGVGFATGATVGFGSTPALQVIFMSSTEIIAYSPLLVPSV